MDYKPSGLSKRRKELIREQQQREKAERRERRKREKGIRGEPAGDEDPDIAGIVPGPQPPPEE